MLSKAPFFSVNYFDRMKLSVNKMPVFIESLSIKFVPEFKLNCINSLDLECLVQF